jgi:hypothetical protein
MWSVPQTNLGPPSRTCRRADQGGDATSGALHRRRSSRPLLQRNRDPRSDRVKRMHVVGEEAKVGKRCAAMQPGCALALLSSMGPETHQICIGLIKHTAFRRAQPDLERKPSLPDHALDQLKRCVVLSHVCTAWACATPFSNTDCRSSRAVVGDAGSEAGTSCVVTAT